MITKWLSIKCRQTTAHRRNPVCSCMVCNDFYILRVLLKIQKEKECAVEMYYYVAGRASGAGSLPPFSRPSTKELHNGNPVVLPTALLGKVIRVYLSG